MDGDRIARRLGTYGGFLLLVGVLTVEASNRIFGSTWLPSWPELFGSAAAILGLMLLVAALGAFAWARVRAP